jgi:hypothetical protein
MMLFLCLTSIFAFIIGILSLLLQQDKDVTFRMFIHLFNENQCQEMFYNKPNAPKFLAIVNLGAPSALIM